MGFVLMTTFMAILAGMYPTLKTQVRLSRDISWQSLPKLIMHQKLSKHLCETRVLSTDLCAARQLRCSLRPHLLLRKLRT